MFLMIDNYDSFVYNLARYLEEQGHLVKLIRNDKVTLSQVENMMKSGTLEGIIISPGPKSPKDCGNCAEILKAMAGRVPILGVCLGHQIIGHVFGAEVVKGERPMHGKVTPVITDGTGVFENLPRTYEVTRYHSLVVSEKNFPDVLKIDARTDDGVIMGISHREMPVYGVQFHPEAVLTQYGHELLENFAQICTEWWRNNEDNDSKAAVI